jgi:hypothetical protein
LTLYWFIVPYKKEIAKQIYKVTETNTGSEATRKTSSVNLEQSVASS